MLIFLKNIVIIDTAMEKKRYFNTKMIATTGILVGIEILLQVIGNYINPGFANINLSLVPIAIGAILYGPVVGGFLGLVCGVMVLISPSTMQFFFSVSPAGTVLACLLKTTLAGIVAGLVVKPFKEEKKIYGVILASALVPIINTGIFAIFCLIFFMPILQGMISDTMPTVAAALFMGMIGVNFLLEIISTMILTPSIYKIIEHAGINKKDL